LEQDAHCFDFIVQLQKLVATRIFKRFTAKVATLFRLYCAAPKACCDENI